jgi:hypothetical protein
MDFGKIKRLIYIFIAVVAGIRLLTPLSFVPPSIEDNMPALLELSGLRRVGFSDIQGIIFVVFVFLNVLTIMYAWGQRKKSLAELGADEGTAVGRTYLSLLDILVWEVYLFMISLVGVLVASFTMLSAIGKFQQAAVYGVILIFCLSQATGVGAPKRKPRNSQISSNHTGDPSQTNITKYA